MGRAGKIHLGVLGEAGADASVLWLVDINPKPFAEAPNSKVTSNIDEMLSDEAVNCVIISTPTPEHAPLITKALAAGKHVFAEKPLCCGTDEEVGALFALAEEKGLLLYTAYNRRFDPKINEALKEVRSGVHGKPLGATLVSRDFPYPPASYLALSGNIFKDCVVHDLDYLTWMLDDPVVSLRAHASTGDDPRAAERACGMWEYSEVHLTLLSGTTATLVNGRVSTSYEHRLDVYCEHGAVHVEDPYAGTPGKAFSDRFADSYHAQLAAFRDGVRAVMAGEAPQPNLDLARTLLLERLVKACEKSVSAGGSRVHLSAAGDGSSGASSPRSVEAVEKDEEGGAETADKAALRTYGDDTAERVKQLYATMRAKQSVEHVRMCREKYCTGLGKVRMSVWGALDLLNTFVDVSDPDVTLPNLVHAFQTAEGLRAMRLPDWLQLTGLIHDLGKMMAFVKGCDEDGTSVAQQWSIVGDTWVVGCAMPDSLVFPEFNAASPDKAHAERTTETGIYEPGCGLDNVLCAFGHDEYMYQVLAQNEGVKLPAEALYVVRYHSLYPWHDQAEYASLESAYDRTMKGWVKLFNQHDLYTKRDVNYTREQMAEMRAYYTTLIDKYLPAELNW